MILVHPFEKFMHLTKFLLQISFKWSSNLHSWNLKPHWSEQSTTLQLMDFMLQIVLKHVEQCSWVLLDISNKYFVSKLGIQNIIATV
jgi:hypothetical protein